MSIIFIDTFPCEFCSTISTTAARLKFHQSTVKKCLNIQGKTTALSYECKHCAYNTGLKSNLKQHIRSCRKTALYEQEDEKRREDKERDRNICMEIENRLLKREIELRGEYSAKFEKEICCKRS